VSSEPPEGDPYKPLPLQLELPPVKPAVVGIPTRGRRDGDGRAERAAVPWRPLVVAVVLLGAIGAATFLFALPRYVRSQCIEQARSHGIALTVDDVSVDLSRFHMIHVAMTAQDLPGARLTAPEVEVETSWLQPKKVSAKGMELSFQGRWDALAASFDKWGASDHGFKGSSWAALAPVITDGSRIVWTDPIGEGARIEAAGVHADVSWRAGGGTVLHASSDNVSTVLPGGTFGPWRVDVDRAPGSSRTCVALDPGVPGMCTVLVVGDEESTTAVDVVLPRSPLARLGIPLQLIGLHGKDLQVDATVHYATRGATRADAAVKGGVHGIEAAGIPRPLDVNWDAALGGDPRTGIDVKQARLAVGPLVGGVKGTFKRYDDGFRVDLAWSAGPVPCAAFDSPLAAGQPFDIAYQLRKLAESAGLTKLTGDVKASATLTFDSRDLGSTAVHFVPEASCSLFGH
jgi:hypothetical protein